MITIDTKELRIGMYVSKLDRPWEGTPFLFQGFVILNEKRIKQLQGLCKTVEIDEEQTDKNVIEAWRSANTISAVGKAHFDTADETESSLTKSVNNTGKADFTQSFHHSPNSAVSQGFHHEEEQLFEEEINVAKEVYKNTTDSLQRVLSDFRIGKDIEVKEVESCVNHVVDEIVKNPNALTLLSNLKSKQQDTVRHSLNVCILSLLFGRHLGFDEKQLSELGFAALLHDVGEIKIPQAILDKHSRGLTHEEKAIMEKHTEYGAEMLRANKEIPASAAEVALSHHERINGKGYPRGLKGDEICLFSRLLTIVDVYEIVTNHPGAKIQVSSSDALKSIYSMRDSFFDKDLVESFIKCLGVYPVGSVVRLSNNEIGIVIGIKQGKHLLPTIMVVRNSEGDSCHPPRVINLDNFRDSNGNPSLLISKVVDPHSFGIDLSDYIIREMR